MLKTKVKANSITNLTDARYFAAWEVEWLGFNLNQGAADYIEPTLLKAIKEWVDGVKFVGEFDLSSADEVNEIIQTLGLDAAQLGMFTPLATFQQLEYATTLFKEIVIEKETTLAAIKTHIEAFAPYVKAFVLNFDKNNISWSDAQSHNHLDVAQLTTLCQAFPIIFSLTMPPSTLIDFLAEVQPFGWSVKGGAEEKVGFKSFDELDDFFEVLEEEV
ncbi:MAG: N-(5'-phosphoribosyl)anthranilate isomerase [Saprospiraceae bacterium]